MHCNVLTTVCSLRPELATSHLTHSESRPLSAATKSVHSISLLHPFVHPSTMLPVVPQRCTRLRRRTVPRIMLPRWLWLRNTYWSGINFVAVEMYLIAARRWIVTGS